MFSKILLPVDGSENSERALKMAVNIQKAQSNESEIIILNVYKHHSHREVSLAMVRPEDPEPMDHGLQEYAHEVVKWGADKATKMGATKVRTVVHSGPPARTIVATARDEEAELIVIGSRGLGDLQSFLLGSVSHKVTSLADVPVLVV